MEIPCMPWFFDRAGPPDDSRCRRPWCCLPLPQRRRHPGAV